MKLFIDIECNIKKQTKETNFLNILKKRILVSGK